MSSTSVLLFRHVLFIPLCKFRFANLELFFYRIFIAFFGFYKALIAFFIVPPPTTISPS